jgi:hypothetical protein
VADGGKSSSLGSILTIRRVPFDPILILLGADAEVAICCREMLSPTARRTRLVTLTFSLSGLFLDTTIVCALFFPGLVSEPEHDQSDVEQSQDCKCYLVEPVGEHLLQAVVQYDALPHRSLETDNS